MSERFASMVSPALLAAALLAAHGGLAQAQESDVPLEELEERAFKQAAALASESVVQIQTVGGLDRVGQLLTGTGPTTGVVLSEDGYVISSAFNFASKPSSILVQLPDGRRFTAKQVATDHLKMLTLLKIDAEGLTPARPAEKGAIRVGQWAIALGRTYSLKFPSVSVGIVSALNRIWGKAIQTDAKVSPVNYGGPLVDVQGRTMGILVPLSTRGSGETAGVKWYDSGIGFAIPMEDVYAVFERLKSGDDMHAGLMGINFRGRNLLAGKPIIDRVRPESPADKAGLQPGDVIVEVAGTPVTRQAEVKQVLGTRYAGESVAVAVKRDEKTIESELTLVAELTAYESGYLGILPIRRAADAPAAAGVGIRHVFEESPAAQAKLQKRDRIVQFNDQPVDDAAELLDLVSRVRPGETASLVYERDNQENQAEIEIGSIPDEVPAELLPTVIPVPRMPDAEENDAGAKAVEEDEEEQGPRTGRFTAEMPGGEHSYWAYVPDGYNPAYRYGLMVWIHPGGDTMEAALFQHWKAICDARGIMILAPKAAKIGGWTPNEAEFVTDALERFTDEYSVDSERVFLHTFSSGGSFAFQLAFKNRELFRGMAVAGAPLRARPPANDPDYRLQFHFVCGEGDNLLRAVRRTVKALRSMKYPVSFTTVPGQAHVYPPEEQVRQIGRWADCLDRI